jgi:hypothetical protein
MESQIIDRCDRQLCLDALVEEGDVNMDWRLGYEEYRQIMKEEYIPSSQGKFIPHSQ